MFEKEAEEYAEGIYHYKINVSDYGEDGIINYRYSDVKEAYQKGAEFAYKKGFEERAKARLNVTTISDCPIKDEWHYVKDGLPEELHDVLCFVIHNEHRFVLQGYLRDERWVLSPLGTYLNNDDVIAWKEIVLPELKENE